MRRLVQAVLRSLALRLLVPVVAIVTLVMAAYGVVTFWMIRSSYTELAAAEARRSSELVLRAVHDRMLEGAQSRVQHTIDALTAGGRVTGIRLYTTGGRIAQSTVPEEIGSTLDRRAPACASCHVDGGAAEPGDRCDLVATAAGLTRMRHFEVIPNDPSCADCHGAAGEQPILGVLDLELEMSTLDRALDRARAMIVGTLTGVVLLVGVASTVVVRRLVDRPVRQLYAGTRRIALGDLDTPLVVRGSHELAALAEAFNQMAQEVKRSRQEAASWSQRLEEKVVAKTDELRQAQRQVLHTERMASLGRLAATVAHELNNPLAGILSCARLVERELSDEPALPEPVRESVGVSLRLIDQECSRCGSIVQNLLLFARNSGGTEMARVDVDQIVDRSLMLVRHRLELAAIRLDREADPGTPGDFAITANAGELEQALVALLVNAIEAMEADREGVLTVRLRGDEGWLEVTVADTGVGIHPEVLPHIFEPFFSTKQRESGVGLGLAIVYGIVQRHGGTIGVDSSAGEGTTVTLRLPREQGAPPAEPARRRGRGRPGGGGAPGGATEVS